MNKSFLEKEKGYALIVVLLVITVILILSPTIISKIVNSTLQYKHAEENIQIDHLERMGIEYMESAIAKAKTKISPPSDEEEFTLEDCKNQFENELDRLIPEELTKQLKMDSFQFHVKINRIAVSNGQINVDYTVDSSLKETKTKTSNENSLFACPY